MEALGVGFNELDRTIGQGSGYTTRLVAGKKKRPDPAILEKIAQALGVTIGWIVSGEGDTPTPPPPPVSQVRETEVSNDVIDELLAQAWDPEVHGPADARVVGEALRSQAALLRGHVDPIDVVRAMLDTSAEARDKGKTIAAEDLPIAALGSTKLQLRSAKEKIAQMMADARAEGERLGVKGRSTPDPILLAQRERQFGIPPEAPVHSDGKPGVEFKAKQEDPEKEPQRPKGKPKKRAGGQ